MRTLFDLTDQEVALCKTVRRRAGWSEAYLRLPDQSGGVIRLVPDAYLRWGATQQPMERALRTQTMQACGGDLRQAVERRRAQPAAERRLTAQAHARPAQVDRGVATQPATRRAPRREDGAGLSPPRLLGGGGAATAQAGAHVALGAVDG